MPTPVATTEVSPGRFRVTARDRSVDLYLRGEEDGWRIIVRPAQPITISFRMDGPIRASRIERTADSRVYQTAIGNPVSHLNDSVYNVRTREAFVFTGPIVTAYGGDESGGVRAEFTRFSDTLIITRRDDVSFEPPASTVAPDPATADLSELRAWWSKVAQSPAGARSSAPPALSGERANILRLCSSVDGLRQIDAEPPGPAQDIWVTHVLEGGHEYSVVTILNREPAQNQKTFAFEELGLNPSFSYAVFDFWNIRMIGMFAGIATFQLPPNSSRTFIVRRSPGGPAILGISTHLLGPQTANAAATWNPAGGVLSGTVSVQPNRPVSLYINSAAAERRYKAPEVTARGGTADIYENRGFWRLELRSEGAGKIEWTVRFRSLETVDPPEPAELSAGPGGPWFAFLTRSVPAPNAAGYYVFRNDMLIGYFADNNFADDAVEPATLYAYTVVAADFGGQVAAPSIYSVRTGWPSDGSLLHLRPQRGLAQRNVAFGGSPITVGDKTYPGIGTHGGSEVVYLLCRAYTSIHGFVAVDDASPAPGPVTFKLIGDERELWSSAPVTRGELRDFSVDVRTVYRLSLVVEGPASVQANWLSPNLTAKPHP